MLSLIGLTVARPATEEIFNCAGRCRAPVVSRSKLGLLSAALALFAVLATRQAAATEYYVATTGNDSNAGTMAAPFASLQKGADIAVAGDTVWLRGGTYALTKQVKLSKSGQSDAQRIKFWAYQKEVPIFDFSGYVTTNSAADVPQILLTGNWLHLRGFEIANGKVGASGAHSNSALRSEGASNNTFELLDIHHNFGPGLFISKGTGGNLILNCDSHDNYDKDGSQGDGQNGDGFGVHYQTTGPSTILRGNRAWIDSDDGYDLISQEVPVIIENCWAFSNGYSDGGAGKPSSGNGNGFKAGSSETGIRHVLQHNVAWKNRAAGFYANHSSGGNTWLNNTSYMNAVQYNMLASSPGDSASVITLTGALAHKMRNNIGFPNKNTNMTGVDSTYNTWDLNISEASTDFLSTADTGAMGPRQADGSLPAIDFVKLRANSPLIDKGTNVMLPYVGTAPDLGAYEYGAVAGGSSGGGASAGAGNPGAGSPGAAGSGTGAGAGGTPGSVNGGSAGMPSAAGASGASGASGTGVGGASTGSGGTSMPGSAGGPNLPGGGSTGTSLGGSGSDAPPNAPDEAGCACNAGNTGHHGALSAAFLAGLLALLSRRRRG